MASQESNLRLKIRAGTEKRKQKADRSAKGAKTAHSRIQKGHALARKGSVNELTKMGPDAKKRLIAAIFNPRLHPDKEPVKRQPGRLTSRS